MQREGPTSGDSSDSATNGPKYTQRLTLLSPVFAEGYYEVRNGTLHINQRQIGAQYSSTLKRSIYRSNMKR